MAIDIVNFVANHSGQEVRETFENHENSLSDQEREKRDQESKSWIEKQNSEILSTENKNRTWLLVGIAAAAIILTVVLILVFRKK